MAKKMAFPDFAEKRQIITWDRTTVTKILASWVWLPTFQEN